MIGVFPSSTGGLQDRLIWVDETTDAVNFIGGVEIVSCTKVDVIGSSDVSTESILGVADAEIDSCVEPNPIFALTAYEYVLSVAKLDTINDRVFLFVSPTES